MFNELFEKLKKVGEQLRTAPTKPRRETPTEPYTPTREPQRKPRTPLKPEPGTHPKPKAKKSQQDIELFKRARNERVARKTS